MSNRLYLKELNLVSDSRESAFIRDQKHTVYNNY